jgi:D-alanyl-D-alanine dipeptidase
MLEERLSKEQEAAAKDIAQRMEKYSLQDDDGVLDSMIFDMKKAEAQLIIQRGLEAQIRYIVSRVGGEALKQQQDVVDSLLMDFSPEGDIIECSHCRVQVFKDKAVLQGQNWFCKACNEVHGLR